MWEALLNICSVKQQGHLHFQPNPQGSERKAWFTFSTSAYNLEDIWNSSTSTPWERDFSPEGTKQIHNLTLFVGTEGAWAWNYQFPPTTCIRDKARSAPETHEADTYKAFLGLSLELLTGIQLFSSCGFSQLSWVTLYLLWTETKGKWFLHLTSEKKPQPFSF